MTNIYNRNLEALSNVLLMQKAPSIFKENPQENVSNIYKQIKTIDLINIFRDMSWKPIDCQENRVNKPERSGYQKHAIKFQNDDYGLINDIRPQIMMVNSHDATCSYRLNAGLFRICCFNGLIVGDNLVEPIRLRHVGFDSQDLVDAIFKVRDQFSTVLKRVTEFKEIELSTEERYIYGESALMLRDEKFISDKCKDHNILKITSPRRKEDEKNNLWNIYNITQEKLIKGDVLFNENGHKKKIRKITQIESGIKINKALWNLTEKMAELKKG